MAKYLIDDFFHENTQILSVESFGYFCACIASTDGSLSGECRARIKKLSIKLSELSGVGAHKNGENHPIPISITLIRMLLDLIKESRLGGVTFKTLFRVLYDATMGEYGHSCSTEVQEVAAELQKAVDSSCESTEVEVMLNVASQELENMLLVMNNAIECGAGNFIEELVHDIGLDEDYDDVGEVETNYKEIIDRRFKEMLSYVELTEFEKALVNEKEIDMMTRNIVEKAVARQLNDMSVVMYGLPAKFQTYICKRIAENIIEKYLDLGIELTLAYEHANRVLNYDVVKGGDVKILIVLSNTAEPAVMGIIDRVVRDVKPSNEYFLVMQTDYCGDKLQTGGREIKLSISKESFVEYINNCKTIEMAGKEYKITPSARNKLKESVMNNRENVQYTEFNKIMAAAVVNAHERNPLDRKVTVADIISAVSSKKSDAKATLSEIELVKKLEEELKKTIKGQDEAIATLVRAVKIATAGLNEEDKPIASMIFVGPTGTGKTETAKQLAKALGREFIRIDMGDYKDKTSVNKLIGASAGYVGYDDGAVLKKEMAGKEHCVILFDEIEKADRSIYDVMMHMLDNGIIKDNKGEAINFRDAIIIMTSNAGATELKEKNFGFGERKSAAEIRNDRGLSECVEHDMSMTFRPEFLNRFDAIVQFNSLKEEVAREIAVRLMNELAERAKRNINISDEALDMLAKTGIDLRFGAREIKRVISKEIKARLADIILYDGVKDGDSLKVTYSDDKFDVVLCK